MDTETGKIVGLTKDEEQQALHTWLAFKAGLLQERPRLVPVIADRVEVTPETRRRKRKRKRGRRSYREFCR